MTAPPADFIDRLPGSTTRFVSLQRFARGVPGFAAAPRTLKILVEAALRRGQFEAARRLAAAGGCDRAAAGSFDFWPGRVLTTDLSGVPLVVDLAHLRDAVAERGGDPSDVDAAIPVDLIVDHSLIVDSFGRPESSDLNAAAELRANGERFQLLKWAEGAFANLRIVPPGKGICHQINLEHLTTVVRVRDGVAAPDSVLGTDSHTTMVNGLGVLGWGTGGIEAELAMLGEPVSLPLPEFLGIRLIGAPAPGVTVTDVILTLVERLRRRGVVGKFVEFFGPGLRHLAAEDRATIANMAPDFGATAAYFPIDGRTLDYLRRTARPELCGLVETYARVQGLWSEGEPEPAFADLLTFDLADVEPSVAGPSSPEERRSLAETPASFEALLSSRARHRGFADGDLAIAAVTSCTNTSNPAAVVTAALLARRAADLGLRPPAYVKTSFSPGSRVVSDYLRDSGLQAGLDALGFHVTGYGCGTCIGNSGALTPEAEAACAAGVAPAAVLSGNRNFPGRVHPRVPASYLASPALVVAYALAGTVRKDLTREPVAFAGDRPVFLKDLWPPDAEVDDAVAAAVRPELFARRRLELHEGGAAWDALAAPTGLRYPWRSDSNFISEPDFLRQAACEPDAPRDLEGARVLLQVGDGFTTDHISPAGEIVDGSPAAAFLRARGVEANAWSTYGVRRGHQEVMTRGGFGGVRVRNELTPQHPGPFGRHHPSGEVLPIYEVARRYREAGIPMVVVAGRSYGAGSSRDWAAKATALLGVQAVVAEGFERIHRTNLIGMGVLPVRLQRGDRHALQLTGAETIALRGLSDLAPNAPLTLEITRPDGRTDVAAAEAAIQTEVELTYYRHGGLLPYALRRLLTPAARGPAAPQTTEAGR